MCICCTQASSYISCLTLDYPLPFNKWSFLFFTSYWAVLEARGGIVVKALRYKLAGRRFDSRRCHWNFSNDIIARLPRLWVRIPLGAWMFICCECCVLPSRGLCDGLITRPEESHRMWRVVVCDLETSNTKRLKPATRLWKNTTTMGCNARKTDKKTNKHSRLRNVKDKISQFSHPVRLPQTTLPKIHTCILHTLIDTEQPQFQQIRMLRSTKRLEV
jgi:hypothetical protein